MARQGLKEIQSQHDTEFLENFSESNEKIERLNEKFNSIILEIIEIKKQEGELLKTIKERSGEDLDVNKLIEIINTND